MMEVVMHHFHVVNTNREIYTAYLKDLIGKSATTIDNYTVAQLDKLQHYCT